jgi:hypothetical protein
LNLQFTAPHVEGEGIDESMTQAVAHPTPKSETKHPPKPGLEACYWGANGVQIEVCDESAPYVYANIFHAKLRVVARIPGSNECYERTLERMGVYVDELDRARSELLAGFENTTLPYLLEPDFPARFAENRRRAPRRVARY